MLFCSVLQVVINAPWAVCLVYNVISGCLDDVQKAKIRIFSSDQNEWLPVLREIMDDDQIPKQYGGSAPTLTPEEVLTLKIHIHLFAL